MGQQPRIDRLVKRHIFFLWIVGGFFFSSFSFVQSQNKSSVAIKRKPVSIATVRDQKTIDFFIDQFFIPETEVDSIDFIDVDGYGFSEKDVMLVYPTEQIYNMAPSDTAMALIRQWKPTSVRVVGQKGPSDEIIVKSRYPAADAMFAGLIRLIEKNYIGKTLSLMFDYDGRQKLAELLIWGYKEKDLLQPKNPLQQFAHDLIVYERIDTLYIEKPVYDIIYIKNTVSDSTLSHNGQL